MEVAATRASGGSSPGNRYGSDTYKQVYIYGGVCLRTCPEDLKVAKCIHYSDTVSTRQVLTHLRLGSRERTA